MTYRPTKPIAGVVIILGVNVAANSLPPSVKRFSFQLFFNTKPEPFWQEKEGNLIMCLAPPKLDFILIVSTLALLVACTAFFSIALPFVESSKLLAVNDTSASTQDIQYGV